ncbi:Sulfide dehydrogenase [flavocytochrome c] flavoprotein chain precursor [Oligella ureolytica]|uniref:NAD(P)/FAD-dependent oxidoreductase n=1 Tax=Oligella ureolytica TaxID=90244 RepID=A0A378XEZ7_9BURK|nr:FAD/NAD(P)-binding oxidoreductase [Oligella ureolytica]QPT40604.1 NAD(P)/FAD-dependent oxidoreductase [Oligella ureolytica]SUA51607.1 Sulfide dehydrogenase [flavocytochrome c] flavoprotein chain precursor [Oligella ureolytica]
MKRRSFLLTPPALALGSIALPNKAIAAPLAIHSNTTLLARRGKGPRIVICGGGWGGLTAARHIQEKLPEADVILLEKNPTFWSGPMSNKWLIDIVDTQFVNRDMLGPANKYGYTLIHVEVTGFDRAKKIVHTGRGTIDYDYLILAGGIRDNYQAWFGEDREAAEYTRRHFPNAYIPNQEMYSLKNMVHNFKGGTIVMTLPPPPHRCPPSPYERACLMAWYFKKNNIPAKILILDPKPIIAPITEGYKMAFSELYPDIIQHIPNATVQEVDPYNKKIKTAAGEFDFDEAVLMPPHQASDMVWYADLIVKDDKGKLGDWADTDERFFTARDDDDVYVIGDSVGFISDQFGYYPKSAHVANAMAKIVAQNIYERVKEQEVIRALPDNLCYMMVNAEPRESIAVFFEYELDASGKVIQTQIDMDVRNSDFVEDDLRWIKSKFDDFL